MWQREGSWTEHRCQQSKDSSGLKASEFPQLAQIYWHVWHNFISLLRNGGKHLFSVVTSLQTSPSSFSRLPYEQLSTSHSHLKQWQKSLDFGIWCHKPWTIYHFLLMLTKVGNYRWLTFVRHVHLKISYSSIEFVTSMLKKPQHDIGERDEQL